MPFPKISVVCYIKNNDRCGFCLWESMASLMPFASEYLILDLGSDDYTLETLQELAKKQPKIRIEHSSFYRAGCGIFADLANDMVKLATHDIVLFHQADEIWHENLLDMMHQRLSATQDFTDWRGMSFWRYQLQENFQRIKWYPHIVQRLGLKSRMVFDPTKDGMNPEGYGEAAVCSNFAGMDWEQVFKRAPEKLPTHEMILDVSKHGGFIDTIRNKNRAHAPVWGENTETIYSPGGQGQDLEEWYARERENPNWFKRQTPFDIPGIMHDLVGCVTYGQREAVLTSIAGQKHEPGEGID